VDNPFEPTNERLKHWLDHSWAALNGNMSMDEFTATCRALLAAREELADLKRFPSLIAAIADRDARIAELQARVESDRLAISGYLPTINKLTSERDSTRAETARLRMGLAGLYKEWQHLYEQLAEDDPDPESTKRLCMLIESALSATPADVDPGGCLPRGAGPGRIPEERDRGAQK
jgi:chromosome segregation ATPase